MLLNAPSASLFCDLGGGDVAVGVLIMACDNFGVYQDQSRPNMATPPLLLKDQRTPESRQCHAGNPASFLPTARAQEACGVDICLSLPLKQQCATSDCI